MSLTKNKLVEETQILTPEFSELLGMYFVCEKTAKHITKSKTLNIATINNSIKTLNLNIAKSDLDLIFNTGSAWKSKNQKSFRIIRNSVCHNCSITDRNFAVKNKTQYKQAMQAFLDEIYKLFERKRK